MSIDSLKPLMGQINQGPPGKGLWAFQVGCGRVEAALWSLLLDQEPHIHPVPESLFSTQTHFFCWAPSPASLATTWLSSSECMPDAIPRPRLTSRGSALCALVLSCQLNTMTRPKTTSQVLKWKDLQPLNRHVEEIHPLTRNPWGWLCEQDQLYLIHGAYLGLFVTAAS